MRQGGYPSPSPRPTAKRLTLGRRPPLGQMGPGLSQPWSCVENGSAPPSQAASPLDGLSLDLRASPGSLPHLRIFQTPSGHSRKAPEKPSLSTQQSQHHQESRCRVPMGLILSGSTPEWQRHTEKFLPRVPPSLPLLPLNQGCRFERCIDGSRSHDVGGICPPGDVETPPPDP